ncbi:histidine kinase, partial [Modestobacter sp. VKM Ac-2676]
MSSRSRAAVLPAWRGDGGAPVSDVGWWFTVLFWHIAVTVMLGAAVLRTLADVDGGTRVLLLLALGALAGGYAWWGVPALLERREGAAGRYLAVVVAVVGVLAWVHPSLLFLMSLVYPQVWFVVPSVPAGVRWTLALAAAGSAGPLLAWTRGEEPLWGPGQTLLGMVISLALGLWVHGLLAKSQERADLIGQLEATRAELAVAHREQGVLAERERLSREVHDTLAQGYTSIVVLAQTAAAQLPGDPGGAAERVALIEEVARDNLSEA